MITTQTSMSLAKSLRPDWHGRHRRGNQRRENPPEQHPWAKSGMLVQTVGWISRH